MKTFVQIGASVARNGDAELLFDGEIRSTGSGFIGREILLDLTSEEAIAELRNYPRLIEPTLTLLVRLIRAAPARSFLSNRFTEEMVLTLNVRPGRNLVIATDVLHMTRKANAMAIHLLSPVCIAAGHRIPIPRSLSVSSAIWHAVRGALGWRRKIPLVPCALTRVPNHRNFGGGAFVQLDDIPLLPRRHLRKVLRIDEGIERVDAALWSAFLESLRAQISNP